MKKCMAAACLAFLFILSGCDGNDEEAEKSATGTSEKSGQSAEFRKIDWKAQQQQIRMTGEAKSSNGLFYYRAEAQDGKELIQEKEINLEHKRIFIPYFIEADTKDLQGNDVAIFILYTKDEKGNPVSENHIPLKMDQVMER